MTVGTKKQIVEQHQKNVWLNSAIPAVTPVGAQDFSADGFYAPLDERIIASAAEALEAGQTHYVDVPGIAPLRQAIVDYLNATYGTALAQGNVIVTAGAQESRFLTIQMLSEATGKIAIPSVVHPGVLKAIGVRPLTVTQMAVDSRLLATVDSIQAALEAGNRLILLESPSRLTGAVYDGATVQAIQTLIVKYEATLIWDQGFAPWVTDYAAAKAGEQVVAIGEAFPGSGLSSWFIGYIAAPTALVPTMQSQKQIMAICTSTAAQYAALEASKLFGDIQRSQLQRLQAARQTLVGLLQAQVEVISGAAANVVAVRLGGGQKEQAISRLEAAGYRVSDGAAFGAADVVRLSVSHSDAAETVARLVQGA